MADTITEVDRTGLKAENELLRRNVNGWLQWYRLATDDADDDCEYLNSTGWRDAEALASTSMGLLAARQGDAA